MSPTELIEALERLQAEAEATAQSIKAPHAHSAAWWGARAWALDAVIRSAREHLEAI